MSLSLLSSKVTTLCKPVFTRQAVLLTGLSCVVATPSPFHAKSSCSGSGDGGGDEQDWIKTLQSLGDEFASSAGERLQTAVDTGIPTQVSYGFVSGFCSGYALKKAGRVAAGVLGLGFVTLQSLSYFGYIKVDHVRIKEDFDNFMDLNKDGQIDKADAQLGYEKAMEVLAFNLPGGSGFGAGFLGGLRSG
mmetsp:Transcript_22992/g.65156  ORF Transcript_22992/g.65156 Transcript_22992/m.65156 type:complete len:190 (+) Transcript_22992:90-659(+)|eukprot:CAMPEP_0119560624 /NCGR_PEP_ID=MMETSP1352-20130426/15444_1 /TAXON_ID=265584 /ORGANISM="Stauroneis constricta, Strain CCMP1120" /LENGTH=189 /DNA_ID=CAMNT_0007608655 /DNA_START=28 /DNA_END=597 /DNA_ORIENTATION=+